MSKLKELWDDTASYWKSALNGTLGASDFDTYNNNYNMNAPSYARTTLANPGKTGSGSTKSFGSTNTSSGNNTTTNTAKTQRSYSGSYMGNTNAMTQALAQNGIQMINNGQKAAITSVGNSNANEDNLADLYSSFASGSYGGGSGGIGYVNSFTPSDSYSQAMAYTNQLLEQLSSGRTSYTDKINEMMDSISNRASFSYDPDTDPLFQNYLNSAMVSGKTAMQDTMGQASALTGGYGSTYATAAANGAYNNYIQDAYNNLPEYYETALNAYENETNNLYNKLGMYQTADDAEYTRLANAYANNYANAQNMYDQEYNNYWQTQNYNQDAAQYNSDLAYKYASLAQDQAQYEANLKAQQEASSSLKEPSDSQYKQALSAYNEGGWDSFDSTIDRWDGVDYEKLTDYVQQYGNYSNYAYNGNLGFVNTDTGAMTKIEDLYNQLILSGMSAQKAKAQLQQWGYKGSL